MDHDENQTIVPPSFIALYVPSGRSRPTESRAVIAARHDLCEDMAQMLTDHARATLFALSITEELVLDRVYRGLLADAAVVSADEARWVTQRLAELLDWPQPAFGHEEPDRGPAQAEPDRK
jgi:hypothetical protein